MVDKVPKAFVAKMIANKDKYVDGVLAAVMAAYKTPFVGKAEFGPKEQWTTKKVEDAFDKWFLWDGDIQWQTEVEYFVFDSLYKMAKDFKG